MESLYLLTALACRQNQKRHRAPGGPKWNINSEPVSNFHPYNPPLLSTLLTLSLETFRISNNCLDFPCQWKVGFFTTFKVPFPGTFLSPYWPPDLANILLTGLPAWLHDIISPFPGCCQEDQIILIKNQNSPKDGRCSLPSLTPCIQAWKFPVSHGER